MAAKSPFTADTAEFAEHVNATDGAPDALLALFELPIPVDDVHRSTMNPQWTPPVDCVIDTLYVPP